MNYWFHFADHQKKGKRFVWFHFDDIKKEIQLIWNALVLHAARNIKKISHCSYKQTWLLLLFFRFDILVFYTEPESYSPTDVVARITACWRVPLSPTRSQVAVIRMKSVWLRFFQKAHKQPKIDVIWFKPRSKSQFSFHWISQGVQPNVS